MSVDVFFAMKLSTASSHNGWHKQILSLLLQLEDILGQNIKDMDFFSFFSTGAKSLCHLLLTTTNIFFGTSRWVNTSEYSPDAKFCKN